MKYIYMLMVVLVLASCVKNTEIEVENNIDNIKTENEQVEDKELEEVIEELDDVMNEDVEDEVINDIDSEIEAIEENNEVVVETNKVIKLETKYSNPKQEVEMEISYSLNTEWKIETINVTSSNWDLSDFNNGVQVVVWMTLEEASEASVAGASLTSAAFKSALK